MSSFEYYEFYAQDKKLTDKERSEISSWSSRTEASARRAIFTYSYRSFPRDEEQVLLKYFDVFFYRASYGTERLLFKFPKDLVDYSTLKKYEIDCGDEYGSGINVWKSGKFVLIQFFLGREYDSWLSEQQDWLDELLPLRGDILEKDYRSLCIMWIFFALLYRRGDHSSRHFPMSQELIPAKLDALNPSLKSLMDFFEVPTDSIAAASKFSQSGEQEQLDWQHRIKKLSVEKKDEFLARLLGQEGNLHIKLRQELEGATQQKLSRGKSRKISLDEFLEAEQQATKERESSERKKARKAHLAKMKRVAAEKSGIKLRIKSNIERGTGSGYKEAFSEIQDLYELAQHEESREEFSHYLEELKILCERRPAMLKRLVGLG